MKDKKGTPYSINHPQAFLSPRAIERRKRQGIPIIENDLPVNPKYISSLKAVGATIYGVSKWFNAVTIKADEETFERVKKLPFIKHIEYTGKYHRATKRPYYSKKYNHVVPKGLKNHYGYGYNQISMLNGHKIHEMGYRGKGMLVAVLDGGFRKVDIMPFFDSLRANGRMLESRDFADMDRYAYESSSHGTEVLSTMAANIPGLFVGTAPDATYICIKTEDTRGEFRQEEDNWIAGAEYADSIGADVINSSLGYTHFDLGSMNYSYENMDGNTARVSQGADIASSKGILVVNSAGNEGNGRWRYVGAPADADSIMAIGAVDRRGRKASFSSYGPTRDGRIKPSVMARGQQTVVATTRGYDIRIDSSNGTSFASPVMAGMVTSLWQAFPNKTNMEIKRAVEMSGDRANNPDHAYGNGIPDFYKAYRILSNDAYVELETPTNKPIVIPNPFTNRFDILMEGVIDGIININIFNLLGQSVHSTQRAQLKGEYSRYAIEGLEDLPSGGYIVILRAGTTSYQIKILKV